MSNQPQKQPFDRRKVSKRRRILLWTLGATVLLLLFVIVSQQLWLWNIVPLESASDTVVLYALSTLNFIAFVIFSFIFVRNLLKLRRERRERELGSKIKTRLLDLLHRDQLSADHCDGGFLLSLPQSLAGKMVLQTAGRCRD